MYKSKIIFRKIFIKIGSLIEAGVFLKLEV